ncbi:MAG: hypothetical protein RLZZ555_545 [Pseudomonadota bacterium]|jgi:hypothetical protein
MKDFGAAMQEALQATGQAERDHAMRTLSPRETR